MGGAGQGRRAVAYSDDAAQAFEDIALRAAVEQLLELCRGQRACRCLAGIAGVAGGFEGEVAGCGEGPVSEVRRVHGSNKQQQQQQQLQRLRQ